MPPKTRPNKAPSGKAGAVGALLASPRGQRRILAISLLIFVAGAIAATVRFFPGTANANKSVFSTVPAQIYQKPKTVKPDPTALRLARKFIETAVERRNIDASYTIVHPDIKGRLTRKQWDTGNIPVINYPANNAKTAEFMVVYSHPTEMLLNVDLVARPGSGVRPHLLFFIGLTRRGGAKTALARELLAAPLAAAGPDAVRARSLG